MSEDTPQREVDASPLLDQAQHELGVRAQIITDLQDERNRTREMMEKAHRMIQRLRDEAQVINAQTQAAVRAILCKQGLDEVLLSEDDFKAVQFKVLDREDHEATPGVIFKVRDMTVQEIDVRHAAIAKVEAMQKQLRQQT